MATKPDLSPPEGMTDAVAKVWCEITGAHPSPSTIIGPDLEAYCALIATLREARDRIEREGMVVESKRGEPVPHPALAVERATVRELRGWGDRYSPRAKARRRRGYMVDATRASLTAATHLTEVHEGPRAALLTLAWLIDEAQAEGLVALQKAAFGTIPTYLKAADALQITPANPPAKAEGGARRGGRLATLRAVPGGTTPGG